MIRGLPLDPGTTHLAQDKGRPLVAEGLGVLGLEVGLGVVLEAVLEAILFRLRVQIDERHDLRSHRMGWLQLLSSV